MSGGPGEGVHVKAGQTIGDRYRVKRALGAGSMGVVYEAADADGKPCAVKVLLHDVQSLGGTQSVSRFLREAQISRDIRSAHVVSVLDGGIDERLGLPYLVMELLRGEDLEACLGRVKILHPTTAVRIALQACRGLHAAHARGIVHRDVKPANLLLCKEDAGGITVKVCDFGVAKAFAADESLTQSGSILGTPLFMAPEQVLNSKRVDARADIWSIGATLYQALCGSSPFEGARSLAELLRDLSNKPAPSLQEAAPWIQAPLAAIVHGTLVAQVERRCPSMQDLIDALTLHAGGTEELNVSVLQPVPDEVRGQHATRSDAPHLWATQAAPVEGLAAPEPPNDKLVGERLGGKYLVEALLGKGGMGKVYKARAPDGSACAVKIVQQDAAPASLGDARRFVREARTSQAIDNLHVVKVLDADTDPNTQTPYIVMELLQGTDLERHVRRVGSLDPTVAVRVFLQACEGLSAAHALGVVHRDIKPANIFLHECEDGQVVAKICDFGVAKHTEVVELERAATELTRTGGMLGSPVYMSPEQAQNAKQVDARTDVWSLAMSMHEALSGVKPWGDCETLGQLILAICTRDHVHLREIAPWVPGELASIVHKGIARERQERIASMQEFHALLKPLSLGISRVTREDLVAVSPQRRTLAAAPATLAMNSAHAATGEPLTTSTASHKAPERRKRSMPVWAAIAAALGTAGLFYYAAFLRGSAPPPAASANPALNALPAPPPLSPPATASVVAVDVQQGSATPDAAPSASATAPAPGPRAKQPAAGPRTTAQPDKPPDKAAPAATGTKLKPRDEYE